MYIDVPFTKENVEWSLKEIAKELKKRGKGIEAEIILVGGAIWMFSLKLFMGM